MTQGDDFVFVRKGRSPGGATLVAAYYGAIAAATGWLDAAWWLMAPLALAGLPALWQFCANPSAGLRLSHDTLHWHSGRRHGNLALGDIARMRFDTRWDLSVRVTATLYDGRNMRLPDESLPAHRTFESALSTRGVAVERHHFRVF
ncbi:MAG: hypothetical protein ACK5MY_09980 [Jhaorihella sp.]